MPVANGAGQLGIAEAAGYRAWLAQGLAALEAAAQGHDPAEAVTDLPGLLVEIRRAVAATSPPAGAQCAPLAALLAHCRRKAGEKRRAAYDLDAKAATAPTPRAAAYWRGRAPAARSKQGPWRGWAAALYRVSVGRPGRSCRMSPAFAREDRTVTTLTVPPVRARKTPPPALQPRRPMEADPPPGYTPPPTWGYVAGAPVEGAVACLVAAGCRLWVQDGKVEGEGPFEAGLSLRALKARGKEAVEYLAAHPGAGRPPERAAV